MRVFFDAAEMQAKGMPPEELKKMIQGRYKTGYYKAPDRAGVSYMLSPILRTYVSPRFIVEQRLQRHEGGDSFVCPDMDHRFEGPPHSCQRDQSRYDRHSRIKQSARFR